tara:strand:+ start:477 stop:701 length:225 start_codon:yes stop_codon:yes gene_type:complete
LPLPPKEAARVADIAADTQLFDVYGVVASGKSDGDEDMIRGILKTIVVGWIAKKFLGRDKQPRQEPPRREPRRV